MKSGQETTISPPVLPRVSAKASFFEMSSIPRVFCLCFACNTSFSCNLLIHSAKIRLFAKSQGNRRLFFAKSQGNKWLVFAKSQGNRRPFLLKSRVRVHENLSQSRVFVTLRQVLQKRFLCR